MADVEVNDPKLTEHLNKKNTGNNVVALSCRLVGGKWI